MVGIGVYRKYTKLKWNFLDFHCFSGYKTNSYLWLGFLGTKLFVFGKITIQVPITIKVVKPGLKDPAGWNGGIKRLVGLGLMVAFRRSEESERFVHLLKYPGLNRH